MWLPRPIYERIPQFWFLLGLLFVFTGLYLGFDDVLSYWYIAVGAACCAFGAGIFLVRIRDRRRPEAAGQAAGPPDPEGPGPARGGSSHAE